MKLVIFDFDQTLVDVFSLHNKTTEKTFKEIFGKKAKLSEIDFAGKTLEQCFIELAKLKGISKREIKKKLGLAFKRYKENFLNNLPKSKRAISKYILPGVKKLLNFLKAKSYSIAIVTGDAYEIVRAILNKANLLNFFDFIVAARKPVKRALLVKEAIKKARKKGKVEKIFVIGDSIRDIDAGKQFNAITIAVLTGFHSKQKLKSHNPDYIIKNLEDPKILKILG